MQQFCTGRMTFLTSNQRHQNTEIHLHFKETEIKLGTDYVVCNCIDINASERRDVTGTVCDTLAVNMIACAAVCVCVCVLCRTGGQCHENCTNGRDRNCWGEGPEMCQTCEYLKCLARFMKVL